MMAKGAWSCNGGGSKGRGHVMVKGVWSCNDGVVKGE